MNRNRVSRALMLSFVVVSLLLLGSVALAQVALKMEAPEASEATILVGEGDQKQCTPCTRRFHILHDDCTRIRASIEHCDSSGRWRQEIKKDFPKHREPPDPTQRCVPCNFWFHYQQRPNEAEYTLYHCENDSTWRQVARILVPKVTDCKIVITKKGNRYIIYHCKKGRLVRIGGWQGPPDINTPDALRLEDCQYVISRKDKVHNLYHCENGQLKKVGSWTER